MLVESCVLAHRAFYKQFFISLSEVLSSEYFVRIVTHRSLKASDVLELLMLNIAM